MTAPLPHPDGLVRGPWPKDDPLYLAYHDQEWGVPEFDGRALYEKLVLDGFQAGPSWITILRKRENFRRAFAGFEPAKGRALHAQEGRAADAGRRHRAPSSPGLVNNNSSCLKPSGIRHRLRLASIFATDGG